MKTSLYAAAVALGILSVGCSAWPGEKYDFGQLRDSRAVDIESRLAARPTSVKNPFQSTKKSEEKKEGTANTRE